MQCGTRILEEGGNKTSKIQILKVKNNFRGPEEIFNFFCVISKILWGPGPPLKGRGSSAPSMQAYSAIFPILAENEQKSSSIPK